MPKAPPLLPGGVGDCAAPRLLNAAARNREDLRPVGVAEIFAGATGGMSLRRKDGALYDACEERCRPILGWMLCGLFRDGDLVRGDNDHTDDNDDNRDVWCVSLHHSLLRKKFTKLFTLENVHMSLTGLVDLFCNNE